MPATLSPTSALGAATLAPTPACGDDDDEPTIQQTEGPYFTPNSPERTSLLEAGMQGVSTLLSGQVLATDCQPIAGALVDFWHADANGVYDKLATPCVGTSSRTLKAATLETIMPGLYPGRTRHFHVKVQRPNGAVLTTQLYFPDEASNVTDGIFDPSLLMTMLTADNGVHGEFNFVLA